MNTHPDRDALSHNDSIKHERIVDVRLAPEKKEKKQNSFFLELIKFGIIAVFIVLPIRLYIAQPFIVSGSSMEPTFEHGEYLIVDELSYRFTTPERGNVIIFKFPNDPSKFFIKRIVGLPSETVSMTDGKITITSNSYPNGLQLDESYIVNASHDSFKVTLNEKEYFVLGDNRTGSSDSRSWGALKENLIVGRAFLRLLPIARAAVLPGMNDNPEK